MRDDDISYFRRRALQEQVAAQRASCEAARLRHDELATMYRFRAAMCSNSRRMLGKDMEQGPAEKRFPVAVTGIALASGTGG